MTMQLFLGTFSMICSSLFSKQNFPRQRRPGGKGSRKYNVQPRLVEGVWGRSNLPQKKVQQSFLNHSLEPPTPPPIKKSCIYPWAPPFLSKSVLNVFLFLTPYNLKLETYKVVL